MARKSIFIAISTVMIVQFSMAVDYCNIETCRGRPHTVCTYKSTAPSIRCRNSQGFGLTQVEKEKVVNLHNYLRRRVAEGNEQRGNPGPQPAAKSMPNLVWDNELEEIAQRWANQCTWGHDTCRNIERFPVGQNIAVIGTTGDVRSINVESMVYNWYNEVKDFDKNLVSRFKSTSGSPMVGHYTQMVWAKTNRIGCGASKYQDGRFHKFYLVCNYGPSGNFIGLPIYQTR